MRRAGSSLRSAATHREMLRFISGPLCQCSLDRFQPRAVHTCAKEWTRAENARVKPLGQVGDAPHAADRYAFRRAGWNSFHSTRWFRIHARDRRLSIQDCSNGDYVGMVRKICAPRTQGKHPGIVHRLAVKREKSRRRFAFRCESRRHGAQITWYVAVCCCGRQQTIARLVGGRSRTAGLRRTNISIAIPVRVCTCDDVVWRTCVVVE